MSPLLPYRHHPERSMTFAPRWSIAKRKTMSRAPRRGFLIAARRGGFKGGIARAARRRSAGACDRGPTTSVPSDRQGAQPGGRGTKTKMGASIRRGHALELDVIKNTRESAGRALVVGPRQTRRTPHAMDRHVGSRPGELGAPRRATRPWRGHIASARVAPTGKSEAVDRCEAGAQPRTDGGETRAARCPMGFYPPLLAAKARCLRRPA